MRRFVFFGPGVVVLLVAALTLIAGPSAIQNINAARIAADVQIAQARLDSSTILDEINRASRDIAQAALPGVVHIDAQEIPEKDENGELRGGIASGAGWIYDSEGHIITNAHVIGGANPDRINVELYDGRVRQAKLVGLDRATDIAVLRVNLDTSGIALRRATGEPAYIGDRVFAFGSPFRIKFSMSQGIISGLGRSEAASFLGMQTGYTNFIQTDAAMNPGNSGGPLVNSSGRVIGMNTAIANSVATNDNGSPFQGQSAGIGFATPLETIESVVQQIIKDTVVLRGYLGVQLGYLRRDEAASEVNGYDGPGVVIRLIQRGQPAEQAGLKVNDILLEIDGRAVSDTDVLRSLISIKQPGQTVAFKVWRDGATIDVPVKLGGAVMSPRGIPIYIPNSEKMTRDQIIEAMDAAKQ